MFDFLLNTNYVSFPGLGIGEFPVNSTALSAEKIPFLKNIFGENWGGIAWYGVIIMVGILVAAAYGFSRAKIEGVSSDDLTDIILVAIISCVIGARAYYVIFNGGYTSLLDIISIWQGGLAIYGAVIAGIFVMLIMAKIKKISALKLLDIGASSIILGQAIGRWGNFMNVEAFGGPTELPWRMCSSVVLSDFVQKGLLDAESMTGVLSGAIGAHPTFFYESAWNLIGFFLLWALYKKKQYDGQIFLSYLCWYGFGRMLIEGLRTDSLWLIPDVIRVSQLIGGICFVICAALLIVFGIRNKNRMEKQHGNQN